MSCGNCWEVNSVAEKTNVPEIRFAGFTDPWEQRKFSDLADRISIQSSDSDLPQVEYEDIIPGEGTLNKELRDKEGGKTGIKFYAGDVLYGKLRPYLMNYLYPQFNGVAVGDFWVLRAAECDSSFLYRLVQTSSFQRLANVSSGSKMPRADWNLISQSFFAVPANHAEQKAIAKSLADLDNLITLHQRKYDKLCAVKKSMFDKMFPKPGETEPEIRFAGFTDPWEQRKLGDVTKIKTGDSDLQDAVPNGLYPFFVRSDKVERSNRYLFDGEAILVPGEGRLGEIFHYINGKFDYHQRVYKISDFVDVDAKFVMYSMMYGFKKHALENTAKATVDSIRLPTLTEFKFRVPCRDEQYQINVFFSRLDNLITLHQRKLNLLKNTKKSLLDRMFV